MGTQIAHLPRSILWLDEGLAGEERRLTPHSQAAYYPPPCQEMQVKSCFKYAKPQARIRNELERRGARQRHSYAHVGCKKFEGWFLLRIMRVRRLMLNVRHNSIPAFAAMFISSSVLLSPAFAQDSQGAGSGNELGSGGHSFVVGHPFSAIKYARRVRILPDGKQQFLENERYPIQIARDSDGRFMTQEVGPDDLVPECDEPRAPIPPACPSWGVLAVDPKTREAAHWTEGELAAHVALETRVSDGWLNQAARFTSDLPDLASDFSSEDGEITTVDLGNKEIDGVLAHGVRARLRYKMLESGGAAYHIRIHEVWASAEMKLIVRVIDGDPTGEEIVWGLEKVSLQPDPSLFRPPQGYEVQRREDAEWAFESDLQFLESWFAR
jgi:hypothetical protein